MPVAARVVNVKPSRIGSLRALFEVYVRCARERRPMYGGWIRPGPLVPTARKAPMSRPCARCARGRCPS